MDTLESLLLTTLLTHPWGHIGVANGLGVPGRVDYADGVERYGREYTPEMRSRIAGAGFETQDRVLERLGKDSALANALYKAFYLAGGPKYLSADTGSARGDVSDLAHGSKNGVVLGSLGASTVADLAKYYGWMPENQSLRFEMVGGTAPGAVYTYRW